MNNINNTRHSAQTDRTTRTPAQRTSSGRNASGSRIGHSSEGNTYGGGAYADDTYVRRPSGNRSAAHDQARRSRSGGRRYPTSGGGATAHRNPLSPLVPQLIAALLCALDGLPANSLRCAPDAAERLLRAPPAPPLAEPFAAVLPALCREIHCPPRFQSYLHRCLPVLAAVLAQNHPLEKPEP